MKTLPQGVITSLVIPFKEAGSVDWDGLKREVSAVDRPEIAGFCIGGILSGTMGIEAGELKELCKTVREVSSKPLFAMIYPDTGLEALEMAKASIEGGADALLICQPHYLAQPSEPGLHTLFATLRKSVKCPLLLADCFAHAPLDVAVMGALFQDGLIDGVFEAANAHVLIDLLLLPSAPPVYSGIEDLHYIFLMLGAHGILSDLSTVSPQGMTALYRAFLEANHEQARAEQDRLTRSWHVLNHASERQGRLRSALAVRGITVGLARSPYQHLSEAARKEVAEICERECLA